MSISGALLSSISSLVAQSQAMEIAAGNIANAGTVGYKATEPQFVSTSNGVLAYPTQLVDWQGALAPSTNSTAIALSGQGFFVVNSNGNSQSRTPFLFTRAGDFRPDANGNLANADGLYLQGFATDPAGNVVTTNQTVSGLQTINVRGLTTTAAPTQNVAITANLPSTDPAGTKRDVTLQIYDSLGSAHELTLEFTKAATPNQWSVAATSLISASSGAPSGAVSFGPATVIFNPDGTLGTLSTNTLSISGFTTGAANSTITLDLGTAGKADGLTQFAGAFGVTAASQDGQPAGSLTGVSIDQSGLVTAHFDNGAARIFAKIPIATFPAPNGLQAVGGDSFQPTAQSGAALLQGAGSGAAGLIQPAALEQSTVDMTAEVVSMMAAQRTYEASAKVIKTADRMMKVLDRIG